MRLCFFSQEDVVKPQGGTGTYVRNISQTLAARGHEVHVISRHYEDAPRYEIVNCVQVHRVFAPGPMVLYSPLYFQQSRRKFDELSRNRRFDAVHGNMPLMSAWGVEGENDPPVVETVHCTVREELKALRGQASKGLNSNEVLSRAIAPLWLKRERDLLQHARRIISVSAGLKREVVEQHRYSAENITVIPNGIDYDRFAPNINPERRRALRAKLGLMPDERPILYLGRLMERKRAIDLVRALPLVLAEVPKVRLFIVGRHTHHGTTLIETARELKVLDRLTLVNHVPYAEVANYYGMAEAYALPSSYEGFPFTVLEAMASGTPVVASNIPGIDEQIISGVNGLLHPVGDINAIASQLVTVLTQPDYAQALAKEAQHLVAKRYHWGVIGAQTEQVFNSVWSWV